ncbi:MAG: hypothetical protein ACPGXK_14505, partial [Phycisphaerae bacterium]
ENPSLTCFFDGAGQAVFTLMLRSEIAAFPASPYVEGALSRKGVHHRKLWMFAAARSVGGHVPDRRLGRVFAMEQRVATATGFRCCRRFPD